jgi:hypothetical protein
MTVLIHDVQRPYVAHICEALADYHLHHARSGKPIDRRAPAIELGVAYTNSNADWEAPRQLVAELVYDHPGVVIVAYTRDDSDGVGNLVVHVPGHPIYESSCDEGGVPTYGRDEVMKHRAVGTLDDFLGVAVFEALAAAEKVQGPRVIAAPICPGCGDPGECEQRCEHDVPTCERRDCESHDACKAEAAKEDEAWAIHDVLERLLSHAG